MKTIILDTNFIVSALKNKINLDFSDIVTNYDLKIIDKTIDELEKLNDKYSKLAIKIIEKNKIKKIKSKERDVDHAIIKNSKDTIVATLDKELKKQLDVPIITIRQKKYFKIE